MSSYTFYFYYSDQDEYCRSLKSFIHQQGIARVFQWVDIHAVPKEKVSWLKSVPAIVSTSPTQSQPNVYPREQVGNVLQSILSQHRLSDPSTQSQSQGQQGQATPDSSASSIKEQPGTGTVINPRIQQVPMKLFQERTFTSLPSAQSGRSTNVPSQNRNTGQYQPIKIGTTGIDPKDNRKFAVTNAPIMDQPRPEVTGTVLPFGEEWSSNYSGTYAYIDSDMPIPSYSFSAATGSTQEIINDGVRRLFEAGKGTIAKGGNRSADNTNYNPSVF